ncbi:hypothetical protein [Microbacterium sp. 22242]
MRQSKLVPRQARLGGVMGITAGALVAVFVAIFIVLVVRRRK